MIADSRTCQKRPSVGDEIVRIEGHVYCLECAKKLFPPRKGPYGSALTDLVCDQPLSPKEEQ